MPGPDADEGFVSWSATGQGVADRQVLQEFLGELDRRVVRVKGILRLADAPDRRTVVQGVAGRWELTDDGPWTDGGRAAAPGPDRAARRGARRGGRAGRARARPERDGWR